MLNTALEEFKILSLKAIECLNNEDYDALEELISDRSKVIETIGAFNYKSEEFCILSKELGLLDIEEKLKELFNEKQKNLRNEIVKIRSKKNVSNSYYNQGYVDSIFLNKKF